MNLSTPSLVALCIALSTLACGASTASRQGAAAAAAPARPSLAELADRVARGAPPPRALTAALSPILLEELRRRLAEVPAEGRLAHARSLLGPFLVQLGRVNVSLPALEGLFAAEELFLGPPGPEQREAAALLVQMYGNARALEPMLVMQAGVGGGRVFDAADPMAPFWKHLVREAPGQQAAAMAVVLRGYPVASDATLRACLLSFAGALPVERGELSLSLLREIVARPGAEPSDWLALAEVELRTDDLDAARTSLERSATAQAPASPDAARATWVERRRALLRERLGYLVEARSLERSASFDDRLKAGHLRLASLDGGGARALFERLRAEAPDDVRPLVGLVRADLLPASSSHDFLRATTGGRDRLRAAKSLRHRDGAYWGLLIGLVGVGKSADLVSAPSRPGGVAAFLRETIEELDELAREYARFEPDRAALLGFLFSTGREQLNADPGRPVIDRLTATCEAAVDFAERHPTTADAYRLEIGCATLLPKPRALEIARRPLPRELSSDNDVLLLRARVLVGIVAHRSTFELLPDAKAAVAAAWSVTPLVRATLEADVALLEAVAMRAPWSTALAALERARALDTTFEDDRLANNVAIASLFEGRARETYMQPLWRAVEQRDNDQLARANLAYLALRAGDANGALQHIRPLLADDARPSLAVALVAARIGVALGRPSFARGWARTALSLLPPDHEPRHPAVSVLPFVEPIGTFTIRLGVRGADASYGLDIGGYHQPVLMPPSPLSFAELQALAADPPIEKKLENAPEKRGVSAKPTKGPSKPPATPPRPPKPR